MSLLIKTSFALLMALFMIQVLREIADVKRELEVRVDRHSYLLVPLESSQIQFQKPPQECPKP